MANLVVSRQRSKAAFLFCLVVAAVVGVMMHLTSAGSFSIGGFRHKPSCFPPPLGALHLQPRVGLQLTKCADPVLCFATACPHVPHKWLAVGKLCGESYLHRGQHQSACSSSRDTAAADSADISAPAPPAPERAWWSWNLLAWWLLVVYCVYHARNDSPVWSAIFGLFILKRLMKDGAIQVKRGSMARFALRGAILGCAVAVVVGSLLLLPLHFLLSPGVPLLRFGLVASSGPVEELAKLIALLWLSWSGMRFWRQKLPHPASSWPQTRRSIILAGFAVGVGFMVLENALFTRPLGVVMNAAANTPGYMSLAATVAEALLQVAFVRIVFNPHPFLSGVVAGRFAEYLTTNSSDRLSVGQIVSLLWPSALLHSAYNFASMSLGVLGNAAVWIVCLWLFNKTWKAGQ